MRQLESEQQFRDYIDSSEGKYTKLVHFWAEWCPTSKQVEEFFTHFLAEDDLGREFGKAVEMVRVDAESLAQVSKQFGITAVPTLVAFQEGKVVKRMVGFQPQQVKDLVVKSHFDALHAEGKARHQKQQVGEGAGQEATTTTGDSEKESLNERLKRLINKERLTLFMKGSLDTPKCGFSRQIVDLFRQHKVAFWTFDILCDEQVRQGLKEFSEWPTYPQVYLDGELLGGLDVIREEMKEPAFVDKLPKL